jgi:prepilin signal peptidase PulO-like enzyme (type II secretory pathway)
MIMKKKQVLFLALIFSLIASTVLPSKSSATSWAYSFVVWNGYIYEMTDEFVTDIDKKIGQVTKYSDMETYAGNFSNTYKKGTKYFSIKGMSTDEAIAVEVNEGKYKKAIRRGEYQGGKRDPVNVVLYSGVSLILVLIGISLFISRRRKQ